MVFPGDGELELIDEVRLEQAPLEGFVQPGDHRLAFVSGIPIPAEIEEADPVFERPFDLPVHDLHLGVIVIAEGGFAIGIGFQQAPAPSGAGHPAGIKHRAHFDVASIGRNGRRDRAGFRWVLPRGCERRIQIDFHGSDPLAFDFKLKDVPAGLFCLDLPGEGRRGIFLRHFAWHPVGLNEWGVDVPPRPSGDFLFDRTEDLDAIRRDQFHLGRDRGIAWIRELEADDFRASGARKRAVAECGGLKRVIQKRHIFFHWREGDLLEPEFGVAGEADDVA